MTDDYPNAWDYELEVIQGLVFRAAKCVASGFRVNGNVFAW